MTVRKASGAGTDLDGPGDEDGHQRELGRGAQPGSQGLLPPGLARLRREVDRVGTPERAVRGAAALLPRTEARTPASGQRWWSSSGRGLAQKGAFPERRASPPDGARLHPCTSCLGSEGVLLSRAPRSHGPSWPGVPGSFPSSRIARLVAGVGQLATLRPGGRRLRDATVVRPLSRHVPTAAALCGVTRSVGPESSWASAQPTMRPPKHSAVVRTCMKEELWDVEGLSALLGQPPSPGSATTTRGQERLAGARPGYRV